MSVHTRAFLVVFLVVQCILWSQSRFAQSAHDLQHLGHQSSLWRRIPFAGLSSAGMSDDVECLPLGFELALEQCTHVRDQCPRSDTILSVPYLQIYFCADGSARPFIFVALLLWLLFLFSTLGITASDFFTPNLAAIAQFLGLNEDVAGVTLLAFGNASPDVFATFSAMRANSGSLAIGELLGAASFIVSCVAGSMCIVRPFKVDRYPFLRDVGFFTVAICMLLFILRDGMITTLESIMLVVWYVCYAFTVIVGGWWMSRRERMRRIEATVRAEYLDEARVVGMQPYSDESPPSSSSLTVPLLSPIPTRASKKSAPAVEIPRVQTQLPPAPHSRTPSPISSPSHLAQMPSFSLVGAIEFRQVVASLKSQAASSSLNVFDSPVSPYAGGHYHAPRRSRSSSVSPHPSHPPTQLDSEQWDTLSVPLNDRSPELFRSSISEERDREDAAEMVDLLHGDEDGSRTPLSIPTIPSISHTPASPTEVRVLQTPAASHPEVEQQQQQSRQRQTSPAALRRRRGSWYALARTWHVLFPSLHHFKSKTLAGKVVSLLAAPAILALTVTLPVVIMPFGSDGSQEEKKKLDHPHGHGNGHRNDRRLSEFEEAEEGVEQALMVEHEVQEELHEVGFNRWLTAVQCIFGPSFCVTAVLNGTRHIYWALAGTALGGFVLALLVLAFSRVGSYPAAQLARCSVGFVVSIVWIMLIADEVVNVLQTFGYIFGLSDAIIGLTIFAVGNSLADLVANTSVAVFAPMMAFSACFGGPMVNILLGIGISGTYVISYNEGRPYDLHFTPTLITSTVGLLLLLATTLVVVPMKGYVLSRRWGMFLVLAYVVLMSANLAVEVSFQR